MNEEIKQLAMLALRNAFWKDFSALANRYLAAAEGLGDLADQEMQMGELTSIYGRDTKVTDPEARLDLWVATPLGVPDCDTLDEALKNEEATEVFLNGSTIFERRDGEWYFVGDDE